MQKIESFAFFVDRKKKEAVSCSRAIKEELEKKKFIFKVPDFADLIIAMGGDGTILRAINQYWDTEFKKLFLGLNFGGKGFLLNNFREDVVDLIAEQRYQIFEFPFLEVKAIKKDGTIVENISANDIYLERITPQCSKLNVWIDGRLAGKEMMADGIVISTALGSTAYNLSAGGSVVHPLIPVICIRSLYENWPPQLPPLVFPEETLVEIEALEPEKRKVRVTSGELFTCEDIVKATIKKSNYNFSLVILEGENFTERLIEKIMKVREG